MLAEAIAAPQAGLGFQQQKAELIGAVFQFAGYSIRN